MNDPSPKQKDIDHQFAKDLQRKHEQLMATGNVHSQPDKLNAQADDNRVHSAMLVLQLLEEVQPLHVSAVPAETGDTVDNPSVTKHSEIRAIEKTSAAREATIPNLERLGRFKIIQQIGRGGYGIVVRAFDPELHRDVAIKIPRFETALSSESRARFTREAKAAAALNHPGIVAVYETGSDQGVDFIVNEFVDGENLATLLARGALFTPRQSAELVANLSDAIEHAHQRGVLHRDLKPSNILIENGADAAQKIADFGLASIIDQQDFTQTGAVVGTPAYMSPEQAIGNKHAISPSTDVYGLGTILYELLTGRSPFADLPIIEMIRAISDRDPIYPRSLDPSMDRDIEAICLKCLEKHPDRRYSSARLLQADLQRFLNHSPIVARRITRLDRLARWSRRNPVLATLSTALVLALSIGLIVAVVLWQTSEGHRRIANQNETRYQHKAQELETIVDQMFGRISQMPELGLNGMEPVREKMLIDVNSYYKRLLSETPSDSQLLQKHAETMLQLAKIKSSLSDFLGAIDIALSVVNSIAADPNSSQVQQRIDGLMLLAKFYPEIGQAQQQKESLDDGLQLARVVYTSKTEPGDEDRIEFAKSLSEAADIAGRDGRRTLSNELALEAIDVWKNLQSKEILDDATILALSRSYAIAAKTHAASENRPAAREYSNQSIALLEQNLDERSRVTPEVQFLLSDAYYSLGASYRTELSNAMPKFDRAFSIASALAEDHPLVPKYKQKISSINYQRGLTHFVAFLVNKTAPGSKKHLGVAQQLFNENIEFLNNCRAEFPDYENLFEPVLASCITMTGLVYGELKEYEKQLTPLRQSLSLAQKILDESGSPESMVRVLGIYGNLGFAYLKLEKYSEAIENYEFACAGLEKILHDDPDNGTVARFLSSDYEFMAQSLAGVQRHQDALDAFRKSMQFYREGQPETMMGQEAAYLVHVNELVEARSQFDRFVDHQISQNSLSKIVMHGSRIIEAIDKLSESDQNEPCLALKQHVAQVAVEALRDLADEPEFDDAKMLELLASPGLALLKSIDVFQAWENTRATDDP